MTIPTAASDFRVRPVDPADVGNVARLFARLNASPETRCLHAGGGGTDPRVMRRGLGEGTFVLVERIIDAEVIGAAGLRWPTGFLWGPSVQIGVSDRTGVSRDLLSGLVARLPEPPRKLVAFPDEANRCLRQTLREARFREAQRTHIFVASRSGDPVVGPFGEEMRERHFAAFARLHRETFPTDPEAGTDAETWLARRDETQRVFVVADPGGLRLLGYVCVSLGEAPREGFVEFLGVRESARGRGIGGRLLRTVFQWCFDELHLPQVALCVSEWRAGRGGARRLYEREGFTLRFTGVGMRWGT